MLHSSLAWNPSLPLWGIFHSAEGLTPVQFAGAALIFTAITFAQLMQVKKKRTPIPSTQPEIPPDPVP